MKCRAARLDPPGVRLHPVPPPRPSRIRCAAIAIGWLALGCGGKTVIDHVWDGRDPRELRVEEANAVWRSPDFDIETRRAAIGRLWVCLREAVTGLTSATASADDASLRGDARIYLSKAGPIFGPAAKLLGDSK